MPFRLLLASCPGRDPDRDRATEREQPVPGELRRQREKLLRRGDRQSEHRAPLLRLYAKEIKIELKSSNPP